MIDRNTLLAFILIALIFFLWPFYQKWLFPPSVNQQQSLETVVPDTPDVPQGITRTPPPIEKQQQPIKEAKISVPVSYNMEKEHQIVQIKTDLYTAEISSLGGSIVNWTLSEYQHRNNNDYSLIPDNVQGNTGLVFRTVNADTFYASRVNMTIKGLDADIPKQRLNFKSDGSAQLNMQYKFSDGIQYEKTFTFYKNQYYADIVYRFTGMGSLCDNGEFSVVWKSGLNSSESRIDEDLQFMKLYALMGGELLTVNADEPQIAETDIGKTQWIAVCTKYFTAAFMPEIPAQEITYAGKPVSRDNQVIRKDYFASMKYKLSELNGNELRTRVYLGPLEYGRITALNVELQKIMDFGWQIIRPLSKLIYKALIYMYGFIPNYGIVIILFSLLVKLLLSPLTAKSYKSMREMGKLSPRIKEMQAKYKDNPQKLNRAMMALYKEHGVNPAGGCIPILLQMPVFFALYRVFISMIEFRNAPFAWWITDLSSPDTVAVLPFSIPMYGDQFNLLPIIWAVTQFVQSKMTMKDPKQKMMIYIMPIFMLVIFNRFSSGLVLYWTMFNIFSTAQQYLFPGTSKKPEEKK